MEKDKSRTGTSKDSTGRPSRLDDVAALRANERVRGGRTDGADEGKTSG
jgi:hypothetical protein